MMTTRTWAGAALAFAVCAANLAAQELPPPIPPVESITDLGLIRQNAAILARDGTYSALIRGRSVWNFGDTPLAVANAQGKNWVDNSLAWTTNLDASGGITLERDYLDRAGVPAEFLPYTPQELIYNYTHDPAHCTEEPCGAEVAMWPGPMADDPARRRALVFYTEIGRVPGQDGWKTIGGGIAVVTANGSVVRPVARPNTPYPTLMWQGEDEVQFNSEALVIGTGLYVYGARREFLTQHAQLARVPLAHALDRTQWRYYAGNGAWTWNPAKAVTVFDGGAAGNSVFYNAHFGVYMAIYSGIFSDTMYYRVSRTPWGPWSEQAVLLTGKPGWNNTASYAGRAHPEFAGENGRVQYVTYVHATGFLRQDIPLVKVVFGNPYPAVKK